MTNPEDPNSQVPPYGTPEYEAWYAQQHPEYQPGRHAAAEPPQPAKKRHRVRNAMAGTFAGVVALIVVIVVATNSGGNGSGEGGKPAAAATTTASHSATHPKCLSSGMPDGGDTDAADVKYCQAHPGKTDDQGAKVEATTQAPKPTQKKTMSGPYAVYLTDATTAGFSPATESVAKGFAGAACGKSEAILEQVDRQTIAQDGNSNRVDNGALIVKAYCPASYGTFKAALAAAKAPKPKPKPKPTLTVAQQNAIDAAQSYLQIEGFSRLGLISQLSSSAGDGYSVADATFAVDSLHADWNAQAVRSAKSYLSIESFSRAGLIEQLSSSAGEQFTVAQATYAADHVGL